MTDPSPPPAAPPALSPASPLDAAHAAMRAAPEDARARLRYHGALAATMLYVLLDGDDMAADAQGGTIGLRLFPAEGADYVLAFDSEDRLAAFTGAPAPVAEIPGRVLVRMLADRARGGSEGRGGIGLGVNLGAPSGELLPPETVAWLADVVSAPPDRAEARPLSVHAPAGLPDALLPALDGALARAGGLAQAALLARVRYDDGSAGHLLAVLDAAPEAEAALARAVAEATAFTGAAPGTLDITFLTSDAPLAARLARVALRIDLPDPPAAPRPRPTPPGSDPARPPILRQK